MMCYNPNDMTFYQNQLTAKGIPVEELNMNDFAYRGLSPRQLQNIVNHSDEYRHEPIYSRKKLMIMVKEALAFFVPTFRKYGFDLHINKYNFLNCTPCYFMLEDIISHRHISFQVDFKDNENDIREKFLSKLNFTIKRNCHESSQITQRKNEFNNLYCRKKDCKNCSCYISPASYNRLKGMYLYLIQDANKTKGK